MSCAVSLRAFAVCPHAENVSFHTLPVLSARRCQEGWAEGRRVLCFHVGLREEPVLSPGDVVHARPGSEGAGAREAFLQGSSTNGWGCQALSQG